MKKLDATNTLRGGFKQKTSLGETTLSKSPAVLHDLPAEYRALIEAARNNPDRSLIRLERTAQKAAAGVSTIWRDIKLGLFVPPVRISTRNVAWVVAEVDALLAAKALMTRSNVKVDLVQFIAALVEPPAITVPGALADR
jgi:predicted DNA-binding transcriptional regulator AlpA